MLFDSFFNCFLLCIPSAPFKRSNIQTLYLPLVVTTISVPADMGTGTCGINSPRFRPIPVRSRKHTHHTQFSINDLCAGPSQTLGGPSVSSVHLVPPLIVPENDSSILIILPVCGKMHTIGHRIIIGAHSDFTGTAAVSTAKHVYGWIVQLVWPGNFGGWQCANCWGRSCRTEHWCKDFCSQCAELLVASTRDHRSVVSISKRRVWIVCLLERRCWNIWRRLHHCCNGLVP